MENELIGSSIENRIDELLISLDCKSSTQGFYLLKKGVLLKFLYGTTDNIKTLYALIANEFRIDIGSVYSGIRYMITCIYKEHTIEQLNFILGKSTFNQYNLPSELEFISILAVKISTEYVNVKGTWKSIDSLYDKLPPDSDIIKLLRFYDHSEK